MKHTTPLVVGNWKMNPLSELAAKRLATEVKKGLAKVTGVTVVIAPPFPFLSTVATVTRGHKILSLGAQTIHPEKMGAYTGSVSLPMLEGYQITHVIVGHSERRRVGEDDAQVNAQVLALVKQSLTPVICVGETTRDHGAHYFSVIEKQIRAAVGSLPRAKLEKVVIAYEPVWAIGSGVTPSPADIYEMRIFLEKTLTDLYGRSVASKVRILYGGSVTAANAAELATGGHMDGFLVGGASLVASDFVAIVKAVANHD